MHTIELPAEINQHQQIFLQLPKTVRARKANVVVMYEEPEQLEQPLTLTDFLNQLPEIPKGGGLSQEDIKQYIDQERQSWEN